MLAQFAWTDPPTLAGKLTWLSHLALLDQGLSKSVDVNIYIRKILIPILKRCKYLFAKQ
jgi:hypothetical protein